MVREAGPIRQATRFAATETQSIPGRGAARPHARTPARNSPVTQGEGLRGRLDARTGALGRGFCTRQRPLSLQ